MADYGVNIAVAVKNSQAITQLSGKIKETGTKVNQLNNLIENFADITGTTVANSVRNFNKALSDASSNLNNAALGTKAATEAARDFVRAQDAANNALREQAALLAEVRNQGRSGTLRGGTQYSGPIGPGPASATALRSPLPPSVPVALRSPMRPQSLLPQMGMTVQAGQIASDMEKVYASILRLTEKANQEEAQKLQTLRQGTQEVEALAQKYRTVTDANKTQKQLQLEIRRGVIETKQQAAKEAEIASKDYLNRLEAARKVGKERRDQMILADRELATERKINAVFERRAQLEEKRQVQKRAAGSALIGGAFPLLFGQGLGAAAGGAAGGFGGGMIGGEFGFGLSLVGTQIGSLVDQLVQNATDLGKALNPLTASSETIIAAVGKADTEFALLVNELDAAGQSALALQLATEELEKVIGLDGVEALEVFSAGIKGLQNDFTIFVTQLSATVAAAINSLTGETSFVRETRDLSQGVFEARQSEDPEIIAAVAELDKLQGFGIDPKDRIAAQEKIVKLLKEGTKARRDSIELAAKEEERLTTQVKENEVAREARYLLAAQIQLAEAGNDLTNEAVVLARENVIQERYLAEARGHSKGSQQELLAADRKTLALKQLTNDVLQAETAEKERQQRIQEKLNREAERERNRQQKAFERNEKMLLRLQQRGAQQREQEEARAVEAAGALIDRLHAERELRLAILDGTEEQVIRQQRIEQLMQGQEDGMRGIVEKYVELESAELKAIKKAEQLNNLYAGIGQTIETGVVDMITAATDKTKSLAEAAGNALRQLANQLLSFGINVGLGSLGGNDGVGFFSRLFPQRALGGSVSSNRPYMVGERGPELFVPGAQGNVVPNNALGGANVVVNVDASGTQAQGNQPNAKALGAAIGAAVQAELVKQKRPGGLLS